jgi:CheY-like chemotaxis protein
MPSGILLVDDDVEDQFIFRDAMESIDAAAPVHCERNGFDALKYLSSLAAASLPCVIVADLNMPMMNGSEMLVRLKKVEALRNIPVVMYTTSINPLEKEACLRLGAHCYITKPLTYRQSIEVAEMVMKLCRELQENL